ncbi:MAG: MaoC family dehydratase [Alphaproteobacteria bacterium]|nr:MaoC family dehydratase [Alphaproteobacteria bacterium]
MTRAPRYFEDYPPGAMFEGGPIAVTEADIIDFARRFDPQDMHVDAHKAAQGEFGGLIASGWHTAALMMRLFTEHFLSQASSLASPGIDELRWLRPVRPGDALNLRAAVLTARRSGSKPDRGLVTSLIEVLNQNGEAVMTLKPVSIIRCRPLAGD